MRAFFGNAVDRARRVGRLSREELAYRVLPSFLLEIINKYLRVQSEGIDKIPENGPAIIVSNHSGFMGFDALMLGYEIFRHTNRVPRIISHKLWFIRPELSVHAKKMGLVPATFENGQKILDKGELLVLFPEGEEGNFKPTRQRYQLRHFRRGFVRLALSTGAPIIPVVVVGAEETNITVSQIRWAKDLIGTIIPVPLNVLPLPAKWHIKVLDPIYLDKDIVKAQDRAHLTRLARRYRRQLQRGLTAEVEKRRHIFF